MFCCKAINILVVYSLICTTSFASVYNINPKNKNKEDLRELAQKVLDNKVHSGLAVELFSQLVILDPEDMNAKLKLADAYRMNDQFKEAQRWYLKLSKLAGDQFSEAQYRYASFLFKQGLNKKANSIMEKLDLKKITNDDIIIKAKRLKADLLRTGTRVQADKKLIFSGDGEKTFEGIVRYKDVLCAVFMKKKAQKWDIKIPKKHISENIISIMDSVYSPIINRIDNGKSLILPKIPQGWFWCGIPSFNKNGDEIVFTLYNMDIEKGRTYSVFYSEKEKNGAWSKPKIMDKPVNISGSSSRFPSLHESVSGRKMLFFSSSRNGGSGGYDIYYAELDDEFKPISISRAKENVNTSGHEIAPYYNEKESSLYFSSDSYEGSGYFDIIMSEGLPEKGFKKARPLSPNVNSSADETQFYIEPETGRQYVLSNKLGEPFGVKATFSIEKDISENVIHDEAQFSDQEVLGKESVYNLKIRVYDKLTKRSIGGGVVMFVKSKGDESINKSGPGKQYTIKGEQEIIFMVKKENYEDHKFRVSTISKDASEDIIIDVYLRHKLNEDEKAYEYLIEHCGNLKKADIKYMVQIGAFRSRKIKHFESLNLGYKIFEQQLQGLYKYMVYNAETPFEIDNIRQDVINQGISDAFVVPYNKGLRISVKKALKILIPNLDKNEEFISFPIPDK